MWCVLIQPIPTQPFPTFAQLLHASIETGIARAAFEETLNRVRQARPWIDSGVDNATDDPLTKFELGRVVTDVRASEVLLKQAGRSVDAAKADPTEARGCQSLTGCSQSPCTQ